MTATIQTLLLLLAVLVVVAIIARRFNTTPSILLVIAGILLALTPGLPRIELAPELVLFGILPPLIYSAGVAMSWREFRFNLRPLALLASCPMHHTRQRVTGAHWPSGARRLALKAACRQRYREKQAKKHGGTFRTVYN
jgi:hypothetical protein